MIFLRILDTLTFTYLLDNKILSYPRQLKILRIHSTMIFLRILLAKSISTYTLDKYTISISNASLRGILASISSLIVLLTSNKIAPDSVDDQTASCADIILPTQQPWAAFDRLPVDQKLHPCPWTLPAGILSECSGFYWFLCCLVDARTVLRATIWRRCHNIFWARFPSSHLRVCPDGLRSDTHTIWLFVDFAQILWM